MKLVATTYQRWNRYLYVCFGVTLLEQFKNLYIQREYYNGSRREPETGVVNLHDKNNGGQTPDATEKLALSGNWGMVIC